MKVKTIVITFLFVIMLTATAYAHRPIFEDRNSTISSPVVIKDHRISYVVYGRLEDGNDVDFLSFKAKKGELFYLEMLVPKTRDNEEFRPYIALIGKGIQGKDSVPFAVEEGMGVLVIPPHQPKKFYEKFTQTNYYKLQSMRGEIPEDGEYYVAVYSKSSGGKYALTIGEKDEFTFMDVLKFPYNYLRVKYFFSPLGTILGAIAVLAIIYGIVRYIKWKRKG